MRARWIFWTRMAELDSSTEISTAAWDSASAPSAAEAVEATEGCGVSGGGTGSRGGGADWSARVACSDAIHTCVIRCPLRRVDPQRWKGP